MTIEDDIAFLERVPTLHLLSRQALRVLAIGAQSRYVHGGEILFNAGEEAEGGYVVQGKRLGWRDRRKLRDLGRTETAVWVPADVIERSGKAE